MLVEKRKCSKRKGRPILYIFLEQKINSFGQYLEKLDVFNGHALRVLGGVELRMVTLFSKTNIITKNISNK